MPFEEETELGKEMGRLAADLLVLSKMHPESRPHRLLGRELGPLAALLVDRKIIAAARKYKSWQARFDTAEPGETGANAIINLLARANVEGAL